MPIIGYRRNIHTNWNKICLDEWLKYGSAEKAGKALGISHVTVRWNAWRYLLTHMDECRQILDQEVQEEFREDFRQMTDDEFYSYLVRRALNNFSAKAFKSWVIENEVYNYPNARELYKTRYPQLYNDYPGEVS